MFIKMTNRMAPVFTITAILVPIAVTQFVKVPPSVVRKTRGENMNLKWELDRNVCNTTRYLHSNFYGISFHHSKYGDLISILMHCCSSTLFQVVYFKVRESDSTMRAFLEVNCNRVEISFQNCASADGGTFTLNIDSPLERNRIQSVIVVYVFAEPDTPTNFISYYATPSAIFLQWSCSSDNSLKQYFQVQLKRISDNTQIETKNVTSSSSCPSSNTIQISFNYDIHPNVEYEASLCEVNEYGSSNNTKLRVTTKSNAAVMISEDDIVIVDSNVYIGYAIEGGSAVNQLEIECCAKDTSVCFRSYFNLSNTLGHVTVKNVPFASDYNFRFFLYDGPNRNYSLVGFVDNVSVSRMLASYGSRSDASVTIIVLAIISGVLLLSCVVLTGFIFFIHRTKSQTVALIATGQKDRPNSGPPNSWAMSEVEEDSLPKVGEVSNTYETLKTRNVYQELHHTTYENTCVVKYADMHSEYDDIHLECIPEQTEKAYVDIDSLRLSTTPATFGSKTST